MDMAWLWLTVGFGLGIAAALAAVWLYGRHWGEAAMQDYISKAEAPEGDYRIIQKTKTATQHVALVECEDHYAVFASGSEMFSTREDDDQYAEAIVHVPMAVAAKRERVLIIGAGGGITTREALRYPEVQEITAVDIDPIVMQYGKTLAPIVKFNGNSLNHPKVRTVLQDGREYVESTQQTWDVIIVDLPEPSEACPELRRLFSKQFYALLRSRLEPEGAIAVACSASSEIPKYFKAVQATIQSAGLHIVPYHFDFIEKMGIDWGFCLAADRPIGADDIQIRVPTRHLGKERLEDMLRMPFYLRVDWDMNNIQTDYNHLLKRLVAEA